MRYERVRWVDTLAPEDRVVLDANMTEEVPYPRSPARARRRLAKRGIRPHHKRVPSPKVMVMVADGLMIMHPVTWEKMIKEAVQRAAGRIRQHMEETVCKAFSPDANPVTGVWPTGGNLTAESLHQVAEVMKSAHSPSPRGWVFDRFTRDEFVTLPKRERFRWPTSD